MKIAIIGGGLGVSTVLAAALARLNETHPSLELEVVEARPDPEFEIAKATLEQQAWEVVGRLVLHEPFQMSASVLSAAHRSRYNRQPRWKQHQSGSKFF